MLCSANLTTMMKEQIQEIPQLNELNRRLGVIISLLLRSVPQENAGLSLREQINILNDLGVRPRDIAEFLGRTPTHINKELVGIRKGKRRKHEKEK